MRQVALFQTTTAPAIFVAATGQDLNFETGLIAMKNAIFKLGTTLEKLDSANNLSGKSRGENDTGYLIDFSVSASQFEVISSLMMKVTVA